MWLSLSVLKDEIVSVFDDIKCVCVVVWSMNKIMFMVRKDVLKLYGIYIGGNVDVEGWFAKLVEYIYVCVYKGLVDLV